MNVKAMARGCNSGTVLQVRQLFPLGRLLAQRADTLGSDLTICPRSVALGLDRRLLTGFQRLCVF
jgi:hypothetical protein